MLCNFGATHVRNSFNALITYNGGSDTDGAMAQKQESKPACKTLVLDAGPLLSLSPLRGLAERYVTVPQVLLELKDKDAREHFERLGLIAGVHIEVQEPDPASLLEGETPHVRCFNLLTEHNLSVTDCAKDR
jgi:rRNA maturation endonuclease Nob1